jgi:uncharacterized protein YqhQ
MSGLIRIGGQAVLEGVMMRAPHALVVAVRRPGGEIVYKETRWRPLSERYPFLKWPVLRGAVILFETLANGVQALSFSASQALDEEDKELSPWALGLTIAFAFALAIALFVVIPHLVTLWLGRIGPWLFSVESFAFHALDGVIKVALFLLYLWSISLSKDIRRVFQYHGAEHKSIYAYEAGETLTVANARKHSTLHPRCGTAFLLMVLVFSIVLFSLVFPVLPRLPSLPAALRTAIYIVAKILLLVPIAGLSYEWIRFTGRIAPHPLIRWLMQPGLWLQRLTTREPSDDQVEIGLCALTRALTLENGGRPENTG